MKKKTTIAAMTLAFMLGGAGAASAASYSVQAGDSLWKIAGTTGTTVSQWVQANPQVKNPDLIYVGQTLTQPAAKAPATVTPKLREQLSDADFDLFARLVYAESQEQPYEGQVAVAAVVLNRVALPDFPNTVRGVIYERYGSVPAFSPVDNGQINKPADETARKAVQEALAGRDPSKGAVFFYNPELTSQSNWIRSRTVTVRIADHVFAK